MELGFDESQTMLRQSARDFLANECPKSLVRELCESDEGYSPSLWKKMADLGWTGLEIPEEFGGSGGNFVDLVVLEEEMGRALCPSPFSSTSVCALAINEAGTAQQKKDILPKIADGEMIMAFALTEPSSSYSAEGVNLSAEASGDSYILNGTKLFVRDAYVSNCMIVVARTGEGAKPEDGITLLLVDPKASGIAITPIETSGRDRQTEIVFNKVEVPQSNVLGEEGKGWALTEKVIQWGAVAECAEMAGAGQQILELTVDYAKQRVQFGRPIGSFQAIQHKCADMVTDADGAKFITYLAAWTISEGLPATLEVSRAKAWVSDAFRRISREAHQIHGGLGFTVEHDLHLYFGKQKVAETVWGDADFHRKIVASRLLD